MSSTIDNLEWPIECPSCKHKFKKKFGWINRNRSFPCPRNCGANFSYSGNEINKVKHELEKISKEIKKLGQTFDIKL